MELKSHALFLFPPKPHERKNSMLPQTDLDKIKEKAKLFLMFDLTPVENYPFIVKHPFTDSGFTLDKSTDKLVNLPQDDDALARWRSQIKEEIDSADNVHRISFMLTNSYRSAFLKFTMEYMDAKDFSEYLADYWISTESPNSDPNFSKQQLVKMFSEADKNHLMTAEKNRPLWMLPETLTVYRGVTSFNAKNIKALSWKLDQDKAEGFAQRFDEDGTVYEAEIDKKHVLALFNGRNEAKVVVNPAYLQNITVSESMANGFTIQM